MADREDLHSGASVQTTVRPSRELEALESGSQGDSLRQVLTKPLTVVAMGMGLLIVGLVIFLQRDPASLTLEVPEARYELLQNEGRTQGVPIAIQLGPLTVFQISDPLAGGGGATRARQVVENLNLAVNQLADTPGRVITIETSGPEGLPVVVQKEFSDSLESIEIIQVTSDDLTLVMTEDAKLLARIWAERLTDSLRLLLFGDPPEFSRDTPFGGALDTLYVNTVKQGGPLTTDGLNAAFKELPADLRQALVAFPPLPPPVEVPSSAAVPDPCGAARLGIRAGPPCETGEHSSLGQVKLGQAHHPAQRVEHAHA